MSDKLKQAIELLHKEKCSCVIVQGEKPYLFHQRGVKDLYELLTSGGNLLDHAVIADKVIGIGKGAAALMILGGVDEVYTVVLSEPALQLFESSGMKGRVSYTTLVPNIINRAGTGLCPVETLCQPCLTAEECLPLIVSFLSAIPKS